MADIITLQGTIRDFSSGKRPDLPESHPDFETDSFDATKVETGIVGSVLDSKHKPIYVGGNVKDAVKSTQSAAEFARWYADNHLATAQKPFSIALTKIGTNPDIYSYNNRSFFPIDGELLKDEIYTDNEGNQRNFHFTYELHTEFTYQGGEKFTFTGDDDLWIFIDDKLVIDLGGIHSEKSATVTLNDLTWVKYDPSTGNPANEKLTLEIGKTYSLRLFFAERHTTESHFRIDTSIVLSQPTATIIASDPNANELGPDTGEFTLSLDKPALTDLTLKYSVAGTATEGADYLPIGSSVLLPKGKMSAKILVTPLADQLVEGPETVIVTLIGGNGYQTGTPGSATVTIGDNLPPTATIVATDPQASEIGLDPGQFTIFLDRATTTNLTIGYSVAGTATEGADYQPIGRNVLIPQGQQSAIIPVKPLADQLTEGPETVVATLLAGAGYQLGGTITATVTIADNPPIPIVTLVATDPTATKPDTGKAPTDLGEFTISLNQPAPRRMVVNFNIAGSARETVDCQPMPRNATIEAGQTQAKIPVVPIAPQGLGLAEPTVVATLQPSDGCQFGTPITGTVVIKSPPDTDPTHGPR